MTATDNATSGTGGGSVGQQQQATSSGTNGGEIGATTAASMPPFPMPPFGGPGDATDFSGASSDEGALVSDA